MSDADALLRYQDRRVAAYYKRIEELEAQIAGTTAARDRRAEEYEQRIAELEQMVRDTEWLQARIADLEAAIQDAPCDSVGRWQFSQPGKEMCPDCDCWKQEVLKD